MWKKHFSKTEPENGLEERLNVEEKSAQKILFGLVELNPEFRARNFYGIIILYVIVLASTSPLDTLCTMLMTSEKFGVSKSDLGKTFAAMSVFEGPLHVFIAPLIGITHDRLGRKPIILLGLIILSGTLMGFPHLPGVFPYLMIARTLVAISVSLALQAPLIADYIHDNSKGFVSGMIPLLASGGSVFGQVFFRNLLELNMTVETIYSIFSSFLIFGICLIVLTIRGGKYHTTCNSQDLVKNEERVSSEENTSVWKSLVIGVKATRNPWIFIAFTVSFVLAIKMPLSSGLFIIWIQKFYGETEAQKTAGTVRATNLNLMIQTSSMVSTIVGSLIIDKISKFMFLLPGLLLVLLSYCLMILQTDAESWIISLMMITIGIGLPCLSITSNVLIGQYSPSQHRGKVAGLHMACQVLGTMFSNVIGGSLLDIQKDLPYIIFCGFVGFALLIVFTLFVTQSKWVEKAEEKAKIENISYP